MHKKHRVDKSTCKTDDRKPHSVQLPVSYTHLSKVWEGTASELCDILGEDVKPNVLSDVYKRQAYGWE